MRARREPCAAAFSNHCAALGVVGFRAETLEIDFADVVLRVGVAALGLALPDLQRGLVVGAVVRDVFAAANLAIGLGRAQRPARAHEHRARRRACAPGPAAGNRRSAGLPDCVARRPWRVAPAPARRHEYTTQPRATAPDAIAQAFFRYAGLRTLRSPPTLRRRAGMTQTAAEQRFLCCRQAPVGRSALAIHQRRSQEICDMPRNQD